MGRKIKLDCGIEATQEINGSRQFLSVCMDEFFHGHGDLGDFERCAQLLLELHSKGFRSQGLSYDRGMYNEVENVTLTAVRGILDTPYYNQHKKENTTMSQFNFEKAQAYEMQSSEQWLNENFHTIMADIINMRENHLITPHYFDLFFKNDTNLWMQFAEHVKDKNCLEISSGPCGIFPLWGHWLKGAKHIIDPLILKYIEYMRGRFGYSWFDDLDHLIVHALPAEQQIPFRQFIGGIDGFILWRNGIDHFEHPQQALVNLSQYAMKGCYLLFWGDLQHHEAPDDGHMNTPYHTPEAFETALDNLGWEIQHRSPLLRDPAKVLDYGCMAIKR